VEILGIDHIQIAMPANGEDLARKFYGELLGLVEIDKPAELASRGGCWFKLDGFGIHLGVDEDFRPARKAHPAFAVTDLDALKTKMTAAGVQIKIDPATSNTKRFHAQDPFGNRLEFIQDGGRSSN